MNTDWAEYAKNKAGILFVLLGVLLGGLYYVNVQEQEDRANCQQRVNQLFTENIRARAAVSAAVSEAQARVIGGVASILTLPPTEDKKELARRDGEFRRLFTEYQIAAETADRVRAENPFPPIENAC